MSHFLQIWALLVPWTRNHNNYSHLGSICLTSCCAVVIMACCILSLSDDGQNAAAAGSANGVGDNVEASGKVEKPKVAETAAAQEGTYHREFAVLV